MRFTGVLEGILVGSMLRMLVLQGDHNWQVCRIAEEQSKVETECTLTFIIMSVARWVALSGFVR